MSALGDTAPLAAWLESFPAPVFEFDPTGVILAWNAAAERLYGYPAAEVVGRSVRDVLRTRLSVPLPETLSELERSGTWMGEFVRETPGGRLMVVESRCVARYDGDGRFTGGFAIEREIDAGSRTGRHAVSDPLAHDLNNALAVVVNYTSLIGSAIDRLSGDPSDSHRAALRRDVEEVRSSAGRAAQLSHLLVTLARHDATTTPDLLSAGVADFERLLNRLAGAHVTVSLNRPADLWPLSVDPAHVREVLVSEAVRARERLPPGATLQIDAANVEFDASAPGGLPSGPHVRVTVSDSVVGNRFVALLPAAT